MVCKLLFSKMDKIENSYIPNKGTIKVELVYNDEVAIPEMQR